MYVVIRCVVCDDVGVLIKPINSLNYWAYTRNNSQATIYLRLYNIAVDVIHFSRDVVTDFG